MSKICEVCLTELDPSREAILGNGCPPGWVPNFRKGFYELATGVLHTHDRCISIGQRTLGLTGKLEPGYYWVQFEDEPDNKWNIVLVTALNKVYMCNDSQGMPITELQAISKYLFKVVSPKPLGYV